MSIDFSQSFSIPPDSYRVEKIKPLSQFINQYPDEELIPHLTLLNKRFKYYRPICGDGNCFYRACVFLYFSTADLNNYNKIFSYAPVKNCRNIPFQFDEYNVEQLFKYIWKEYLLPIAKYNSSQRQKKLLQYLNKSVLLDSFLIAYFRSLNHHFLVNNKSKFQPFIEGNVDHYFENILNFGRQSQGIELYALAELLKVKITIMMVHKENYQQIVYIDSAKTNFILFYRPGHYDILCSQDQFKVEGSGISDRSKIIIDNRYIDRRHQSDNIVKINNIADLSKIRSQKSYDDRSNLGSKIKNISQFYEKQQKLSSSTIKKYNKVIKGSKASTSTSTFRQQLKTRQKQRFNASKISIPNVKSGKMILQCVIIVAIILLVIGSISYAT